MNIVTLVYTTSPFLEKDYKRLGGQIVVPVRDWVMIGVCGGSGSRGDGSDSGGGGSDEPLGIGLRCWQFLRTCPVEVFTK